MRVHAFGLVLSALVSIVPLRAGATDPPVPTPVAAPVAAPTPATTPPAAPRPVAVPYRFTGRALYLGVGAGVITALPEATFVGRFLAVFPLVPWLLLESGAGGGYFRAQNLFGMRR